VVAAEDDEGLLKPKAFVMLKQGMVAEGLEVVLKEHVKKSCGMWKYPRRIKVVDSLRRPRPARSSTSSCAATPDEHPVIGSQA
jgi:acyl-coenzyme A synthetase/AMP-(fatty) acid ligase